MLAAPVRRVLPAAIRAAQSCRVRAVPVHVAEPRTPPSFFPSTWCRTPDPTPPLSPLPPLQKASAAVPVLSSLFPSLSSTHDHVGDTRSPSFSRLSSTQATEPPWSSSHSDRGHYRFSPLPTVRLAYLPPLPYLGPPSPLSSSLIAPGASRSHR
jgi:hypothetical protein